jgi:hypothetical protein
MYIYVCVFACVCVRFWERRDPIPKRLRSSISLYIKLILVLIIKRPTLKLKNTNQTNENNRYNDVVVSKILAFISEALWSVGKAIKLFRP